MTVEFREKFCEEESIIEEVDNVMNLHVEKIYLFWIPKATIKIAFILD